MPHYHCSCYFCYQALPSSLFFRGCRFYGYYDYFYLLLILPLLPLLVLQSPPLVLLPPLPLLLLLLLELLQLLQLHDCHRYHWYHLNELGETTHYLDEALKRGNTLIHCQMGQRRSPTILIAWLSTRNLTVEQAINFVNEHYVGLKDWARGFRRERVKWIAKLVLFKTKFPQLRKFWKNNNSSLVDKWLQMAGECENSTRGEGMMKVKDIPRKDDEKDLGEESERVDTSDEEEKEEKQKRIQGDEKDEEDEEDGEDEEKQKRTQEDEEDEEDEEEVAVKRKQKERQKEKQKETKEEEDSVKAAVVDDGRTSPKPRTKSQSRITKSVYNPNPLSNPLKSNLKQSHLIVPTTSQNHLTLQTTPPNNIPSTKKRKREVGKANKHKPKKKKPKK
eukprot:TRINITY_DN5406_c0_g2_i1.p1 TRINITY_DN5406_c0_g2~~TRINITY_DN5406_c0_g2_i1.p1  ORF type:complete len:390 (+),score=104.75 TRINITY_DN5406_c0_g2_i1:529-1698(+)